MGAFCELGLQSTGLTGRTLWAGEVEDFGWAPLQNKNWISRDLWAFFFFFFYFGNIPQYAGDGGELVP